VVHQRIDRVLAVLEQELEDLDRDLHDRLRQSPLWREQEDLLRGVPGVGPALTFSLLADLPELGTLSSKQIAALVGVAPLNRDSGRWRGKRAVWGGRANVRAALYMPTVVAVRWNPVLRDFYQRLVASPRKSPWWPACGSSWSSSTQCSSMEPLGERIMPLTLDNQDSC
jgi:transposase